MLESVLTVGCLEFSVSGKGNLLSSGLFAADVP